MTLGALSTALCILSVLAYIRAVPVDYAHVNDTTFLVDEIFPFGESNRLIGEAQNALEGCTELWPFQVTVHCTGSNILTFVFNASCHEDEGARTSIRRCLRMKGIDSFRVVNLELEGGDQWQEFVGCIEPDENDQLVRHMLLSMNIANLRFLASNARNSASASRNVGNHEDLIELSPTSSLNTRENGCLSVPTTVVSSTVLQQTRVSPWRDIDPDRLSELKTFHFDDIANYTKIRGGKKNLRGLSCVPLMPEVFKGDFFFSFF